MPKQPAPAQYTLSELWIEFLRLFSIEQIEEVVAMYQTQRSYRRLFPALIVIWGFIFQRLHPDHSCDAYLSYLTSQADSALRRSAQTAKKPMAESTGGYCKARLRMPVQAAHDLLVRSAHAIRKTLPEAGLWHGLRVNLFDGSTLRLPANPSLLSYFGTASNQHGPTHWPLMALVAGFDLFSGVVNAVAEGPYGTSEQTLAAQLIPHLGQGWLHVGDRAYGVYRLAQVVHHVGSHGLFRLNKAIAYRIGAKGLRSGSDIEVAWSPSAREMREPTIPVEPVPGRLIYLQLEKAGFRPIDLYLFTTLLDREQFSLAALVDLYGERWNVEIDLRHVKSTLEMEDLSTTSVDMVRKELYLGLLGYNLLRSLMAQAAKQAKCLPRELSLACCLRRIKDTWQTVVESEDAERAERRLNSLLERLAQCRLPKRKRERYEPREVWGRPKVYPTIKGSREQARQAALEKLK
jgi:hypothetical protein